VFSFNQIKTALVFILLVVIGVGGFQYYQTWQDLSAKIATAEQKEQDMRTTNAQLQANVAKYSAKQKQLEAAVDRKEKEIQTHLQKIDKIEKQLEQTNRQTIATVDEQQIANEFKKAYNLEGQQNIKVVKVPVPGSPWKEKVLQLPVDYIKKTITAKDSKIACQQQSALKDQVIGLNGDILDLQKQNLALEKQKTAEYQRGYDKAFALYIETNKLYLELLKTPPKVDVTPSWLEMTGGFLGGIFLCAL